VKGPRFRRSRPNGAVLSVTLSSSCTHFHVLLRTRYLLLNEFCAFCENGESVSYIESMGWKVRVPPSALCKGLQNQSVLRP
jgi:hypothetical protein